jgi:hypothetical protein
MTLEPNAPAAATDQPFAAAAVVEPQRKSRLGRVLRFVGWSVVLLLVVAGLSAAVLMGATYHFSDGGAGSMVVQMDGVTVHDAVARGYLATAGLWLACTAGLLIAFGLLLFASVVVLGMLTLAALALGMLGLMLATPLLLVCGLMFWLLRKLLASPAPAAPSAAV